jgi:ribosomal protein S18 acetylase RimI-like enzyme
MPIQILERDVTKDELQHVHEGFDAHQREYGVPVEKQQRYGFVAMDGGRFIGCSSGLQHHVWFYLTDLWLEKSYRRKGLGSALLHNLEIRIAAADVKYIYTWTASYEAPPFYQKQGYTVFCTLEDYYQGGHGRLGFRKTL